MDEVRNAPALNRVDYLVAFVFMATSGNPLVIYSSEWFSIITMSFMGLLCFVYRKQIVTINLKRWIALTVLLLLCQYIWIDPVSVSADVNFISKIISASLFASFLGVRFRWAYFRVMVYLTVFAIICWIPSFLNPNFHFGSEFDRYYTIFFYNRVMGFNQNYDFFFRNSGMFWEPGAFAGFLLFVPMLFIDCLKDFFKANRKSCYILLAGLLTTFSATGYIALMFLVGLVLVKTTNSKLAKVFIALILIAISFYAFTGLEFLGTKITKQIEDAQNLADGDYSWDRFGAMVIDIQNALKHPFIGNGFLLESRYGKLGELMGGAGNGFTGAVNMFGFPFVILYLFGVWKNTPSQVTFIKIVFLVTVVLLLSGEYYLNYAFYWVLLFMTHPLITQTKKNGGY